MTNFDPQTRASLIARIGDLGDDAAWTEFVEIYQPLVERFIQRYSLQHADAAEVSQEVLTRIAKSIKTWDGDQQNSTFRGWLYRITRNLTIDFLRKNQIERARFAGQPNGLSSSELSDVAHSEECSSASAEFQAEYEKQLFHWAAEKLKPQFKTTNWQAFWMSTIDGVAIEEVANRLQIDCSKVYVARSRIMARLAELIKERLSETNEES